ncbi:MAG: hypothetical protein WC799_17050 [Desulfobacteraceae bacterium]
MGQARLRGSFENRKKAAIKRNMDLLIGGLGGRDEQLMTMLGRGIRPFISKLTKEEWQARRVRIIESLKGHPEPTNLEKAKPIRIRDDEIGWYLFLCEQTIENPLCIDIAQAQRILPFFVGIGERWGHSQKVEGIDRKITELLSHYKSAPDGIIFEILVALSYAAKGWNVEFLMEEPPAKSPDMVIRKGGVEFVVECKRLDRRTTYSEKERKEFLRIWDATVPVLIKNRQWLWLKVVFHNEVSTLPTDFLVQVLESSLPIEDKETILHDSDDATIHARLIDHLSVNSHLDKFMVKMPSPMMNYLLGGDWAPENSEVTIVNLMKTIEMRYCEIPILGSYIESIDWACGITRKFDSEVSINKKARDITKLLSDAVKQVPQYKPSIIHIAAETLEGRDVELRRTEKVMLKIPSFVTEKPVVAVRFHRFQSNSRINLLYEFDETVEKFQIDGIILEDIPTQVVVPEHVKKVDGRHWEVYD